MNLWERLFGKGAKIEPIQPPQPLPVWRQDVAQEMRDPWRNMTEEEMLEREMQIIAKECYPKLSYRKDLIFIASEKVTRKGVKAARVALKVGAGIDVTHDQMRIALYAALEAMK